MEIISTLAPLEPCKEDIIKDVVQFIVDIFQNLCNVMIDMRLYELIHTMFRNVLGAIKEEHNPNVTAAMENIMIMTIN